MHCTLPSSHALSVAEHLMPFGGSSSRPFLFDVAPYPCKGSLRCSIKFRPTTLWNSQTCCREEDRISPAKEEEKRSQNSLTHASRSLYLVVLSKLSFHSKQTSRQTLPRSSQQHFQYIEALPSHLLPSHTLSSACCAFAHTTHHHTTLYAALFLRKKKKKKKKKNKKKQRLLSGVTHKGDQFCPPPP